MIEVRAAAATEAATVANLMSLYLFEACQAIGKAISDDGTFRYQGLDAYWHGAGRFPFLLRVDGQLAGFALVAEQHLWEPEASGHTIAELFVLPAYRRHGIGSSAVTTLFDRFPGPWWIAVAGFNTGAIAFWRRVIGAYTGVVVEEAPFAWEDERGILFQLTSPS